MPYMNDVVYAYVYDANGRCIASPMGLGTSRVTENVRVALATAENGHYDAYMYTREGVHKDIVLSI